MWLTNLKVRIKEYPKGFVVEVKVSRAFWGYKWTHLISVSGMRDEPWYFRTQEGALEEAKKLFGWDLLIGMRDFKNE